jgi:hypothetical protein
MVAPEIPPSGMQGAVAACTQGHEVLLLVRSAVGCSLDMVGHRRLCKSSLPSAQLAEGMLVKKLLAGLPPGRSIPPCGPRVPLMAFVESRRLFRMLLAVPSFGETGTAWMAARSLGLVGHEGYSFGQKESPGGFPELCMDFSECTVAQKAY